jgi:cob(I)alamin adenosyltransferase
MVKMDNVRKKLGLVHVYTGIGKGKTTASLGLAFRASGSGLKVLMIQFLKPSEEYGEQIAAKRFDGFDIVSMGIDHMVSDVTRDEDIRLAKKALAYFSDVLKSGEYDLVIADEINVAMSWNLLTSEEVIEVLEGRKENTEVVLTGRGVPDEIIEYADLVTEMVMIKHPFDKGIGARRGIEY